MKYTTEIRINLPRSKVVELFDNPDNLYKWQPGLQSLTHLQGRAGEEGSRSELVYDGRKGSLVITETIIRKKPPEEYHMLYRSRGVFNQVENWFMEDLSGSTLWRSINTFRFMGFTALMAPFMKQAFIQNTMLNMDRFKLFAENPENVSFSKK